MHSTKLSIIASLLVGAMASPAASSDSIARAPTKRLAQRQAHVCNIEVVGTHSYGGGGPGEAPVNYSSFGMRINGTDANGNPVDMSLEPEYKGHDLYQATFEGLPGGPLVTSGSWDGGSNVWYDCNAIYTDDSSGYRYPGYPQPGSNMEGTVVVSSDECIIDLFC